MSNIFDLGYDKWLVRGGATVPLNDFSTEDTSALSSTNSTITDSISSGSTPSTFNSGDLSDTINVSKYVKITNGNYNNYTDNPDLKVLIGQLKEKTGIDEYGIWIKSGAAYIGGHRLYDAVVATDGNGDFNNIQSAINSLPSGGTIFIRNGTYTLTTSVNITTSNLVIVGESKTGTIIKMANGSPLNSKLFYLNGVSNVIISSLQFDGNKANQSFAQVGAWFNNCTKCGVDNCIIFDVYYYGIYIATASNDNFFTNNELRTNGVDGIYSATTTTRNYFGKNLFISNARGIRSEDSRSSIFEGNRFYSNTTAGMSFLNTGSLDYANVIANNIFVSGSSYGIYLLAPNNTVIGNTFDTQGGYDIYMNNVNNTITGNVSHNAGYAAIYMGSNCEDNIISSNTIRKAGALQIGNYGAIRCLGDNNTFTGNMIIGDNKSGYGFELITVSGNNITGNQILSVVNSNYSVDTESNNIYNNGKQLASEMNRTMYVLNKSIVTPATSPGTTANDASSGTGAWSTTDNVKVSDSVYSTHTIANGVGGGSNLLKTTNYGFTIPTGATILGINVEAECYSSGDGVGLTYNMYVLQAGVIVGNVSQVVANAVEAYYSFGSSTSLWGTTWTSADINNANFGASFQHGRSAPRGAVLTAVDHIRITVYYGFTLLNGNVLVYAQSSNGDEVTLTTTGGSNFVMGMATDTVSPGSYFNALVEGKTVNLKVDGTTDIAIGDYLSTFTTAGIAKKASAGEMAFAVALEAYTANDSNGVIDALLVTPRQV